MRLGVGGACDIVRVKACGPCHPSPSRAGHVTLAAAGAVAFGYLMPISILIVALLFVVTFSYRQTIRAYPNGGGSYIVARANLGVLPGLVAASLLVDYVLTVAVSVSAGIYNLAAALPALRGWRRLRSDPRVMLVNLRGLRESGTVFAAPTYLFLGSMLLMLGLGIAGRSGITRWPRPFPPPDDGPGPQRPHPRPGLRRRLLGDDRHGGRGERGAGLQADRVEESPADDARDHGPAGNDVPGDELSRRRHRGAAGRQRRLDPQPDRGGRLLWPHPARTASSSSLRSGSSSSPPSTSFADFSRLSSILARDGFFPRQFAYRGDRLAFSVGISFLALASVLLVAIFAGDVNRLIPLYAICGRGASGN